MLNYYSGSFVFYTRVEPFVEEIISVNYNTDSYTDCNEDYNREYDKRLD